MAIRPFREFFKEFWIGLLFIGLSPFWIIALIGHMFLNMVNEE